MNACNYSYFEEGFGDRMIGGDVHLVLGQEEPRSVVIDIPDFDTDDGVAGFASGIERHDGDFVQLARFPVQRLPGANVSRFFVDAEQA